MNIQHIVDDIYRLSVNITEENHLFEGIWPIPDGISINGYLIKGEKTVMIDLAQDIYDFPLQLTSQMRDVSLSAEDIDILVVNHMEPDHTGWLKEFCQINKKAVIYCTKKAVPLLKAFGDVEEDRAIAISDGMILDIGEYELQFFETPNIHWPETMMTYERKRKILFSCDGFGSYGKVEEGGVFDDQLTKEQIAFYESEALRYYANIVSNFTPALLRGIEKLDQLEIDMVCPAHGIVWRENPSIIIDDYRRYGSYGKGPAEKEVTLVWGSMYGKTEEAVGVVIDTLGKRGIPVHVHKVPGDELGFILADVWKSSGLIFAMPTYEYKMFPPVAQVIHELIAKKMSKKKVFRFGSYGWSGGAQRDYDKATEKSGWDFVGNYEWQGALTQESRQELEKAMESFCDAIEETFAS